MYEELKHKQLIKELKNLVEKAEAETDEDENDMYCAFMKGLILNTYSTN